MNGHIPAAFDLVIKGRHSDRTTCHAERGDELPTSDRVTMLPTRPL